VTVGAGPTGEKFSELGDAMVGALVPNPVQDDEGQGGGLHRRSEEGNENEGSGGCSPHHDSSRGEEKRDEVGFRRLGSDSGKHLARLPAGNDFPRTRSNGTLLERRRGPELEGRRRGKEKETRDMTAVYREI